jgi:putative nucleotidyltransferase with HDIG domain
MEASTLTRRLFWVAEGFLLAGILAASVLITRHSEWHPALLLGLLLVLAVAGEWFSVEIVDGQLSASVVAIVLAMGLLGPVAAAACGIAAMVHRSAKMRLSASMWLNNLATLAAVPFAGGLVVRALTSFAHAPLDQHQSALFGLIVFGAFIVTLPMNLVLVGLNLKIFEGSSLTRQAREFLPLLSGEFAAGALAAILAVAYENLGVSVLFGSVALLLIYQRLNAALVRSEHRAEQIATRSRQLVSLQLGIAKVLVRALKMRDPTTGQHASASAHYCVALAREIGCSDEEQEVVRTAALLHDIGKFAWPDRVLHAEVVADDDRAIVENHAQEGALIVGALDGYGAAADAILYHHERIDGSGYPAKLIGSEIPLASRILAICCTFDTMTGRGTYRSQLEPEEALGELRSGAANGQFDPELVESFVAMVSRQTPEAVIREAQEADFETALEFERRVQEMAEPDSIGRRLRSGGGSGHAWRSGVTNLRALVSHKK